MTGVIVTADGEGRVSIERSMIDFEVFVSVVCFSGVLVPKVTVAKSSVSI